MQRNHIEYIGMVERVVNYRAAHLDLFPEAASQRKRSTRWALQSRRCRTRPRLRCRVRTDAGVRVRFGPRLEEL
jgi:hypothetical protein